MFDPKKLLDQFLGAGGGNLQQTLGGVLGQLGQGASQVQGRAGEALRQAGASDLAGRGREFLSSGTGTFAAGAAAGGLLSAVLGSKAVRSVGGDVLKLGGMAVIGGLAYKAYSDYQAGRPILGLGGGGSAPTAEPALLPPPSTPAFTSDATAQLVLQAMITAAKADGHIDDKERARILGEMPAGSDERSFLEGELAAPVDIEALAARATTPDLATQVYAASLVAIDPDTDVERAYLARLAERLNIDASLKAHLEATVAQAKG